VTGGVKRGHFYVNGHDLGRYWSILMNDNSGRETQSLYHIPKEWVDLKGGKNLLTLGEVVGATDLQSVMVIRRQVVPVSKQNGINLSDYYTIDTCPM